MAVSAALRHFHARIIGSGLSDPVLGMAVAADRGAHIALADQGAVH